MAVTLTKAHESVFGDLRVVVGSIDMTGVASGAVQIPNMVKILGMSIAPASCTTTTNAKFYKNQASGATATNGMLQISNAVSGDVFEVVIYGT